MPRVNCGTSCTFRNPFNGGNRNICQHTKQCACEVCAPLSATPFLWDGCVDACNNKDNRPTSTNDYLRRIDTNILFNNYGILLEGTAVTETVQGRINADKESSSNVFKYAQFGVLAFLLGTLGLLIYKRFF